METKIALPVRDKIQKLYFAEGAEVAVGSILADILTYSARELSQQTRVWQRGKNDV